MGVAIALQKAGFEDFVILERATDLGGTWRDNTYPGLTVDVPVFTYCYSFEPNPDWSSLFAPQPEVQAYAQRCADKYGIRRFIEFGQSVHEAVYDQAANRWNIHLDGGRVLSCRYLVNCSGLYSLAKWPDIEGIDDFQGHRLHTTKWDDTYELTGKRVAIIGTGSTAVQLLPEIVERVEHLDVYQRRPIWLLPKPDVKFSERAKRRFRRFPILQRLARLSVSAFTDLLFAPSLVKYPRLGWLPRGIERLGIRHIRKQIDDPELQQKLTPDFAYGCKRPSFSNTFYPIFNRPDVALVTDTIDHIDGDGIVTVDGQHRPADVLICATGFALWDRECLPTYDVVGRAGVELRDFWQEHRFQAFRGATVPGFPNFFLILGPYSQTTSSYFGMIENQTRHLLRCLGEARRRGATCIEVTQRSHDRDFAKMTKQKPKVIYFAGNCATSNTIYVDHHGDAPFQRPVVNATAWWQSHFFRFRHYHFDDPDGSESAPDHTPTVARS